MFDIAMYGLGVMGSSLAKNLIDKGFRAALFSKDPKESMRFSHNAHESWRVFSTEKTLAASLVRPRVIFLMITAGEPVDRVIDSLLPYLESGDMILDGGNSHYKDTTRRVHQLKERNIGYLGIGVSGGEKGALMGPSMMAGGSLEGWEASRSILQKIAAHHKNQPCCSFVGPEGAGHYVKMVHNGIEYGILQLIADIYFIMKRGLALDHDEIETTFSEWQSGRLNSYLIEITVLVLRKRDEDGTPLVDKILDVAKQKGTGNWTAIEAIERGVYAPTLCEAVFSRHFSANQRIRTEGNQKLTDSGMPMKLKQYKTQLEGALLAGIICSYAQGLELIQKASDENHWRIDLSETAALWREGCIIRSPLLETIMEALQEEVSNLLISEKFSFITSLEPTWREVVIQAQRAALSVPTLVSTLCYYDRIRGGKMPANLVQALRDCFGAHTYERTDREGPFHTNWEQNGNRE
ncbi:NADP-dependent phosphogluconate dehydrogenase [Anoxybacterium hadale]|uniref:NADP-dependent phosphogluconate dehydrogenase n=1 Tax=Anoxybacterium hadale TaxID=3408580 RepID=A0ACD1AF82_9FIRM|nr:NADP-dependent phosphogluconate dehydrogenase [Clostridiales bacterium]